MILRLLFFSYPSCSLVRLYVCTFVRLTREKVDVLGDADQVLNLIKGENRTARGI